MRQLSVSGGLIDKKPLDENIYVMIIMYYLHSFLGTRTSDDDPVCGLQVGLSRRL